MILDFAEAFFVVPLHPAERRYFVIRFLGRYLVFKVQAQGAGASPLCWGRVAALLGRLTQGMFREDEALLATYVDDPCFVLLGTSPQRQTYIVLVILVWSALGFPLSFRKGQCGRQVTWIGNVLTLCPSSLTATIKAETLKKFEAQVVEALSANVVTVQALRSLAGRGNHIASLLWAWRPFLQGLWAALSTKLPSKAPNGCVWTKQVAASLTWLLAFLRGREGSIVRTFTLEAYFNYGPRIRITLDASPWGLGGALFCEGRLTAWFTSQLSADDAQILGIDIGSCKCQQAAESLAALVAFRLWLPQFLNERVLIYVVGDSVTMLSLVLHMRPATGSRTLGIIARELALDVASCIYSPDVAEHIPGIANVLPDALSRRFEPKKTWSPPPELAQAVEHVPPLRDRSYYRTLSLPSLGFEQASSGYDSGCVADASFQ